MNNSSSSEPHEVLDTLNNPDSNRALVSASILILLAIILISATSWSVVANFLVKRSSNISAQASTLSGDEAYALQKIAYFLDSKNTQSIQFLSLQYLGEGDPARGAAMIQGGGDSATAEIIRIKLGSEMNDSTSVKATFSKLDLATLSDIQRVDIAMCLLAVGDTASTDKLLGYMTDSKQLQRIIDAKDSTYILARTLASSGLLNSSERLLKNSSVSYSRNMLLISILTSKSRESNADEIRDLYSKAIALNPTSITTRKALQDHLVLMGENNTKNTLLIDRLNINRM